MSNNYLRILAALMALGLATACSSTTGGGGGGDSAGDGGGTGGDGGGGGTGGDGGGTGGDGGGTGGDGGGTGGDSGLLEDITLSDYVDGGAGSAFVANVQTFVDILDAGTDSALAGSFEIPSTGNATFSGTSIITDITIPESVDTVEEAAGYLIVTGSADVSVNLGAGSMTVTMEDFIDVEDNPVSGSVTGTGTFTPGFQAFAGTVSGNVAGTGISAEQGGIIFGTASSADGVFGSFFGEGPNGGIIGSGGPFAGDEIAGAYAAE